MQSDSRKSYLAWLAADTATAVGASLRSFALPVLVLVAGGSAVQAGGLRSLTAFTVAATALIGGVLIDRYDRRFLLLLSSALGAAIFAVFATWAGVFGISFALLLLLAFVSGVKSGLLGNTSNILLRDVVSKGDLPRAMSINQGRDGAVEILGSPLSGFLISIHAVAPLVVEAILNALAFISTLFVKTQKPLDLNDSSLISLENAAPQNGTSTMCGKLKQTFKSASAGIILIKNNHIVRRIAFASVVFFPLLNGLMLLLVFHTLETTDSTVSAGLVNTGVAIGVIVGAFISSLVVKRIPTGIITLVGFFFPIPFAITALLVSDLWLRIGLLTPLLLLLPAGNAAFGGFSMHLIPHDQLGRYFALIQVLELLVTPMVMLFVGYGLTNFGERLTGGILVAGMALVVVAVCYQPILAIPTPDQWEEYLRQLASSRASQL